MRDLQFWLDRYIKVDHDVWRMIVTVRALTAVLVDRPNLVKLRKRWGCALNRDYTGRKIGERRARWLRNRLILITKIAKLKSAVRRLEATKIAFYESKIRALGGTVPRKFGT